MPTQITLATLPDREKYRYFTLQWKTKDALSVYGWDVYPRYSVLAGQERKRFIDSYSMSDYDHDENKLRAQAEKDWPEANYSSQWTERVISYNHLPDDGDY